MLFVLAGTSEGHQLCAPLLPLSLLYNAVTCSLSCAHVLLTGTSEGHQQQRQHPGAHHPAVRPRRKRPVSVGGGLAQVCDRFVEMCGTWPHKGLCCLVCLVPWCGARGGCMSNRERPFSVRCMPVVQWVSSHVLGPSHNMLGARVRVIAWLREQSRVLGKLRTI